MAKLPDAADLNGPATPGAAKKFLTCLFSCLLRVSPVVPENRSFSNCGKGIGCAAIRLLNAVEFLHIAKKWKKERLPFDGLRDADAYSILRRLHGIHLAAQSRKICEKDVRAPSHGCNRGRDHG